MLIEAAWSYRFPARISREHLLRQEPLAKPIRDTAWKAQERLCRRYRKLARAGKPPTVSRPRSLENWRRSPSTFRSWARDTLRSMTDIAKEGQRPQHVHPKTEQDWRHGHGQENPRCHYQPDIFRRWMLDRGSSATHHRSGGGLEPVRAPDALNGTDAEGRRLGHRHAVRRFALGYSMSAQRPAPRSRDRASGCARAASYRAEARPRPRRRTVPATATRKSWTCWSRS
jgi:hypothetical protein